jgi:hypothetical protein
LGYFAGKSIVFFRLPWVVCCKIFHLKGLPAKYWKEKAYVDIENLGAGWFSGELFVKYPLFFFSGRA